MLASFFSSSRSFFFLSMKKILLEGRSEGLRVRCGAGERNHFRFYYILYLQPCLQMICLWKPEPTRVTQGHLKAISRPSQGVESFQEMLPEIVAMTASGNDLPGRLA